MIYDIINEIFMIYDDLYMMTYIQILRLMYDIIAYNYLYLQDNKYLMIKKHDE
jgi:hypothetical protein